MVGSSDSDLGGLGFESRGRVGVGGLLCTGLARAQTQAFPVEVRGPVFQVTAKGTPGAHERGTVASGVSLDHGVTLVSCAGRHVATRASSQDRPL